MIKISLGVTLLFKKARLSDTTESNHRYKDRVKTLTSTASFFTITPNYDLSIHRLD